MQIRKKVKRGKECRSVFAEMYTKYENSNFFVFLEVRTECQASSQEDKVDMDDGSYTGTNNK